MVVIFDSFPIENLVVQPPNLAVDLRVRHRTPDVPPDRTDGRAEVRLGGVNSEDDGPDPGDPEEQGSHVPDTSGADANRSGQVCSS